MIKLKKILYESLLKEALPLSVAKEYASIEQNPSIRKKLDEIFNKLKSLPDAKSSKRGERIYIPYKAVGVESETKDEIEDVISKQGYKVKDYVKGIATDKLGRDVKIGRVLNKLKQPNLLNAFSTDTVRNASTKSESTYVIFSRHSYDIAGMSTDRDWKSCMNIYTGMYREHVQYDVSEGSFIAYYVNANDLNINKPIGRIVIKPFVNIEDKDDVTYGTAASDSYGNPPDGFEAMITKILNDIQNEQTGRFTLKAKLYCDNSHVLQRFPPNSSESGIIEILDSLNIKNYTVNDDLSVDVDGYVYISDLSITEIPVKFGKVTGDFDCSSSSLTSLKGAPKEVGGSFDCSSNSNLTSLKGAPKEVGGHFICDSCKLTSLHGGPNEVGGGFNCNFNELTNLEGAPEKVGDNFFCVATELESLKGAPKEVGGSFQCNRNNLTSLEGSPKYVGYDFYCQYNGIQSLESGPKEVGGDFHCYYNALKSLEGAPKEVGGDFHCSFNSVKFTEEDVRAVSDVKGKILV